MDTLWTLGGLDDELFSMTRIRRSVTLPIVVAIGVIGLLVGMSVVRADSVPTLPPVAPEELVASVLAVDPATDLSGRVFSRIDIGLPELPASVGGGMGGPVTNVVGDQQYRVWRSPDGLRIAHILPMSEQVLVANPDAVWLWDSNGMEAIRLSTSQTTFPVTAQWLRRGVLAAMQWADVAGVVRRTLETIAPWADVRSDTTATVAGRPAYVLTLTPRSDLTLIGSVEVSIDAETRIPLRLDVVPAASDRPAITVAFTDVSLDPIDPATFDFTPPPGAVVHEAAGRLASIPERSERSPEHGEAVRVFGEGFDLRIARRLDRPLPAEVAELLPYQGPLASALTVERPSGTWLLAGPVSLQTLRADAVTLP